MSTTIDSLYQRWLQDTDDHPWPDPTVHDFLRVMDSWFAETYAWSELPTLRGFNQDELAVIHAAIVDYVNTSGDS